MSILRNTTKDMLDTLKELYRKGEFRHLYNNTVKTVEIQNANFVCDKDWIVREPNYDYAAREIKWYESMSLNVNDMPGGAPVIWRNCATPDGFINSNYGWCIWSFENGKQYQHCIDTLSNDPHSRQACMIYNRPSMHEDASKGGMHDFMCTYSTQVFLNDIMTPDGPEYTLKYIVNMRSSDAVFGYNNDVLWHRHVQKRMADDLSLCMNAKVRCGDIEWNTGSLHVYERHFKFLES